MCNEDDWEVNEDGLYIATRCFLVRRGYCCANKCRNCPYINWRAQSSWQPVAPEHVKQTRVSPKAIAGAQAMLDYHEQQLQHSPTYKRARHQAQVDHYTWLLERWGGKKAREDS